MEQIQLSNGVSMDRIGMGLWECGGELASRTVQNAVDAGYRLFDTAMYYQNEADVGRGVASCGVLREELFLTSKLWPTDMVEDRQYDAFERSLKNLGVSCLDLFLLHWPIGDVAASWRVLEALYRAGKIRAIGVSNFQPRHLDALLETAQIPPMVDQLEINPYLVQQDAVAYAQRLGLVVEAWGPLGKANVLDDPALVSIAARHGRSPAQVVLRWHYQRGVVPIPKTVHTARMAENLDIFDFSLTADETARINALDRGTSARYYPPDYDPARIAPLVRLSGDFRNR